MTRKKFAVVACDKDFRWYRSSLMYKKEALAVAKEQAKWSSRPVAVVEVLDDWYNTYQGRLELYDGRLFNIVKTFNYSRF
ncbi:MAG: hypothetical protein QXW98_04195 [Candidatus Caldarchaeum sp.]